jgi:predicted TIM-barrel fold metal-dependent hydrolase
VIIDGHAHVASTLFTPHAFFEGVARNMVAAMATYGVKPGAHRVLDMLIKQNQDHDADEFVAAMDAAGVARAVLLVPDFPHVMKSELPIAQMAERHAQIRARHPDRFHVFMGVDPRWGKDGLDLFEQCLHDYGFEGLKLYPPCGYSPSDAMLFPYYEICRARQLPVLLHTGPTSPALTFAEANPQNVDRAACAFPDVNFILAHGGATNVDTTMQMCAYRPNVFCDISGFNALGSREQCSSHLRTLFARGLSHKIIFGTDWPVFRKKEDHAEMIRYLCSDAGPMTDLAGREKQRILSVNIVDLLPPAARAAIP